MKNAFLLSRPYYTVTLPSSLSLSLGHTIASDCVFFEVKLTSFPLFQLPFANGTGYWFQMTINFHFLSHSLVLSFGVRWGRGEGRVNFSLNNGIKTKIDKNMAGRAQKIGFFFILETELRHFRNL